MQNKISKRDNDIYWEIIDFINDNIYKNDKHIEERLDETLQNISFNRRYKEGEIDFLYKIKGMVKKLEDCNNTDFKELAEKFADSCEKWYSHVSAFYSQIEGENRYPNNPQNDALKKDEYYKNLNKIPNLSKEVYVSFKALREKYNALKVVYEE